MLSGVNSGYARVASNNNASKFTHNVVKVNPKKPSSLIDAIKHETAYDNLNDTEKTLVKPIVTEQDKEKFVDAFLKKSEELTQQARAKYRTSQDDIDNDLAEQHLANGNAEQAIELYQKVYDRAKKYGYLDTEIFSDLVYSIKKAKLSKKGDNFYNELLEDFNDFNKCKLAFLPYKFKNIIENIDLKKDFSKNLKKVNPKEDIIFKNITNMGIIIRKQMIGKVYINCVKNLLSEQEMKKFKKLLPVHLDKLEHAKIIQSNNDINFSEIQTNFMNNGFQSLIAECKK